MTARPLPLPLSPDGIPDELKALPYWIAWRYAWDDERGAWTKVPVDCHGGFLVDATDLSLGRPFAEVLAAYEASGGALDGVGFMLGADGLGLLGVDVDGCLGGDGSVAALTPVSCSILEGLSTYTERSPSGSGVRAFLFGSKPGPRCRTKYEGHTVEVYDRTRFLTVTGHRLPDFPAGVRGAEEGGDEAAARLYDLLFSAPEALTVGNGAPGVSSFRSDEDVIGRARSAKNGPKFLRLWGGDASGYESRSEADAALAGVLAFYTQDRAQLDRLFRRSGLMRPKWDRSAGAKAYGERTLDLVLDVGGEAYSGGAHPSTSHSTGATRVLAREDTEGAAPEPEEGEGPKRDRESAASCIARLVQDSGAELWHSSEGTAFVTLDNGGHVETHALRQKTARRWLARLYYDERGRAPGSQAVEDALGVLEGIALFDGEQHPTGVRVAEGQTGAGPAVYLDLGTPAWEVVEVRAGHWAVIPASACPVRFERRGGMLPLPVPVKGGDARKLTELLNLDPNGPDLVIVLSWLCHALRGVRPFPLLEVTGEQGSGKSTAACILRSLLDPNAAPLRAMPRSDHEAFISAANAFVLAYDNVSGFGADVSDRMCRLSTGGGLSVRELYTTDEERLFFAARPQIINGIEDLATRPDLAERTLALRLRRIDETDRRTEDDLYAEVEATAPGILGGLLDAVAGGLARLPHVSLDRLPRMADFALFATACEGPLGFADGDFLAAYEEGRAALIEATVEGEPVAEAVRKLLIGGRFEGTAAELLDALADAMGYGDGKGETKRAPREWPKHARGLSGKLRRLAPALRALGYGVEFERKGRGKDRARIVTVENSPATDRPHRPRRPHGAEKWPAHAGNGDPGGRTVNGAEAVQPSPPPAQPSPQIGLNRPESQGAARGDGGDDKPGLHSDPPEWPPTPKPLSDDVPLLTLPPARTRPCR